jgi:imidazolonepropionase-like amidohydrolase
MNIRFSLTAPIVLALCLVSGASELKPKDYYESMSAGQASAFVGVQVIPMDREHVLTHQTVVVRGGRIAEIGAVGSVRIPEDAVRINGQGHFLMPGLADMHVHVSADEFPLYLAAGVTTIRNLSGLPEHLKWREQIAKGEMLGPTLYTSGPMISGVPQRFKAYVIAKSPEDAARIVRDNKQAGYDFVKVYDGLSKETYEALMATARKVGIRALGHAPASVGILGVLKERQAEIEHGEQYVKNFFGNDCDPLKIPYIAGETHKADTWFCPTLAVFENIALEATQGKAILARPEMQYVAPSTVAWWKSSLRTQDSEQWLMFNFHKKLVKGMHDAGVMLLAGTDNPNDLMIPGLSLPHELRAFVAAGLTPYEALAAATRNPGEFMGSDFGTIEPGKRADLVLVEQNPLDDVDNTAKVVGVMKGGRWIPKSELQTMLAKLAASYRVPLRGSGEPDR